MPALHAKEVAEKVGDRLPYGRGSESACRVYSHLLSRDRQGAVVLVLFQQPLKRAPQAWRPTLRAILRTMTAEERTVILIPMYNDWEAAELLLDDLDRALARHPMRAGVMFVDDGSTLPMPTA